MLDFEKLFIKLCKIMIVMYKGVGKWVCGVGRVMGDGEGGG